MLRPRGLLARFLVIIGTVLVLLQLVITVIFIDRPLDTITRRLAMDFAGEVATVIELLDRGAMSRDQIFLMAARHLDIRVVFQPGRIMPNRPARQDYSLLDAPLTRAFAAKVQRPFRIDTDSDRQVKVHIQLPDGVLEVSTDLKRLFSPTSSIFLMWMLGTAMILFAVASLFMRNQVRSIRRLASAADAFGKGRDAPDFKPQGAAEVRLAGAAFNLMRARITRQIAQRTEMLAGVSHDLRTPITRMKLQLAMMGEDEAILELKADLIEMEQMIDGYLAFARGEGGEAVQQTDLGLLLGEVVAKARREGAVIDYRAAGDLVLPLRPEGMRRCLANLVGNAVRYASSVRVEARRLPISVEVTIDDDGPGIPPDQREAVFRPFTRLDLSRNPTTGGVGLGLTIARDMARGHGGEIVLEESPAGGLRVRLMLPL